MKSKAAACLPFVWRWTKIAWLLACLVLLVAYGRRQWDEIAPLAADIHWFYLLPALALIVAGRIALSTAAREICLWSGTSFRHSQMLKIYAVTQLAKYVPGGVWHFVARGIAYSEAKMKTRRIAQNIVVENLILLGGAVCVGLVGMLPTSPGLAFVAPPIRFLTIGAALLIYPVAVYGAAAIIRRDVPARSRLAVVLFQLGAWLPIGAAFHFMIVALGISHVPPAYAAGTFTLCWAIAFVAVFVPGGIGLREALLVYMLGPFMPASAAFTVAVLSRIVWTVAEAALLLVALVWTAAERRVSHLPLAPVPCLTTIEESNPPNNGG
ncbi:MAG TPA: hypothetical protein PLS90_14600 [Candidatus Sumerlaeota bacterium]|nr:hypothetical protein [Candidatus Sumerlaeota bacterium]